MKQLVLLNIILFALSAPAHAKTISVFATEVITSYGGFSQTAGGPALANDAAIESIIASDPATAVFGSDPVNASAIDLGFGTNKIFTGAGSDLVIFSLWYGENYNFGLQAFGTGSSTDPLSNFNYSVTGTSIFESCAVKDSGGGCIADISATSINLFGSDGFALADDVELDFIRMFIGGTAYNGTGGLDAYSNFTLIGANYSDALVVPLPLSAVLFSSGLALLGWVGRRKSS
jgi:hypothetical protein